MKKLIATTMLAATAAVAQPTGINAIWQGIQQSGFLSASNYSFEPYYTYAPTAPKHNGGGFLAVYNVNNYVGLGLGGDELGRFNMISVNATLQLPTQPLTFINNFTHATNGFLYSLSQVYVTPFELAGAGKPLNGTGIASTSGAAVIQDTGAYVQFGHVLGGQLNLGACYGQWDNAGLYSGKRYHGFFGWSHGY